MINKKFVYIGFLSLLILVGCNNGAGVGNGDPDITGYVMDRGDQQILVVSTEAEDFSETGGTEEFYNAVWVSDAPDDVEVGEEVSVWFEGGVAESYPAYTSLGELDIISTPAPDGADLSEAEALNKGLSEEGFEDEILTVRSISYGPDEDEWTIDLMDTNSYEEYTLHVEDD